MSQTSTTKKYQKFWIHQECQTHEPELKIYFMTLDRTDTKFNYRIDVPIEYDTRNIPTGKSTISHPTTSPIQILVNKLASLENTPEDERWPRAIWPTHQAFVDANKFIRELPLDVVPFPEIYLADDGEVNFLWKCDGIHIDLGFYGTEKYSYFARSNDGIKYYADDVSAKDGLPSEVVQLFTEQLILLDKNRHRDENTSAVPNLSPGVVEDSEYLIREMFNPQHVIEGEIKESAIPIEDLQLRGFSVHRIRYVTSEFVKNSMEKTLSKPRKNGPWKNEGVAKIQALEVRQIKDSDNNQAFVVIDAATEENIGHASIFVSLPEKGNWYARELRSILLELLKLRMSVDEAYDSTRTR